MANRETGVAKFPVEVASAYVAGHFASTLVRLAVRGGVCGVAGLNTALERVTAKSFDVAL
jgi:hypothetical protein